MPKTITQVEIARFKELSAKSAKIHEELDPLEDSIIERLVAHARIAGGKHKIFLQIDEKRTVAWKEKAMLFAKRLGLDPEEWAKKMLARAEKRKSYQLKAD